jgi:hypothetical protein
MKQTGITSRRKTALRAGDSSTQGLHAFSCIGLLPSVGFCFYSTVSVALLSFVDRLPFDVKVINPHGCPNGKSYASFRHVINPES